MTRRALLVVLLALAACAVPAPKPGVVSDLPPQPAPVVEVADPNFELVVTEAVPNADDEGVSYTVVFADNKEAGKTAVGPRSQERRARLRLPVGNQPVRLEQWYLPPVGEWTRLPDSRQPRERFVRVEDGEIVRLELRYGVDGLPALRVERATVPR